MSPDDTREDIEVRILELLKTKMENNELSETRAQQLATIALETLKPGMSLEELYRAIPQLDNTATEFAPIVLPYMLEYENTVTAQVQKQVVEYIRQGQYDAAVKLSKQAIKKDISITWHGSSQ